jgi:PAS domain S-box-containing protein
MAVGATVTTLYLRILAAPWFGERPVLILFALPILLSAYLGGLKPGLLATVFVVLGVDYYLIEPKYSFYPGNRADVLDLIILSIVGVLISVLMEKLRHARTRNSAERNSADTAHTQLAAIVESSFDAIIGKDLNGIVTSWNAGAERVFGYSAEEMVGNSINLLIPPDRLDEEENILGQIKRGGRVEHFVTIRQRKGGERIDVSVTVSPIKDAEGAIIGASKVARDITEIKKAEEARLLSEARYRSLFNNAPDGIVIADSESRYLDANASVCRMLGYARAEFIGLHASDIVVQTEMQHIEPALSTIKSKSDYHREWQFRRKDGSIFAGEVIATMMPDGNLLGMIRDITERNTAALALREKETQLHASDRRLAEIVQGMTEACFALDTEWRFTFVNDRGETLLRHHRGQMLGRTIWDVFSKLVGTPMEANYRRAMTERVPVSFEVFSPIAERWLDIRLFPTGEGLAAFLLDIHARKLGEESLRATQAQLNSTLSAGSIGTWTWDIANDRLAADAFTARAFSLSADAAAKGLPAAAYLQAVVEEDQPAVSAGLALAIETCGNYDLEYRVRQKEGALLWLQARGRVEGDATGKAANFHGAVMDITARKQMELALQESEERFRTMANSMAQLAWMARPDGFISWYNQRWYEYTGTTPEQMEGWGWQSVHDPGVLPNVLQRWKGAIDAGEPFEMELPLRGADGKFRTFLTRGQPWKDSEGRVVQWFGTNTDVETLKKAEEKIRNLNVELEQRVVVRTAQLEAANKELEAFSYSVSHDLRAPLRAVNGFAGLLIEEFGIQMQPEAKRYLERIRHNALNMGQLIDDLLAFSRLSRQPVNRRQVGMAKLVRDVIDDLAPEREGRQIDIRTGVLPDCWGDSALVKQVWVNLLSNAVKYTRGRERSLVETGCESSNGEDIYYVRDNGAGFDMKFASKLFGVFQRLHRAEDFEGTGVGLAIVQRVVQRHGGRVWADAKVGNGAIFRFTFGGRKEI